VTVRALARVTDPKSGFVTVIDREPVEAFALAVTTAVILVPLTHVVVPTVTPLPETFTVAPLTNLVPVKMSVTAVPRRVAVGDTDVSVG
jgi:hypothetical protein